MVRVPLRSPDAVGVKVTLIVQLALGAKVAEQLLTSAKSPVVWSVPTLNATFPVFVRVTACVALEVPTCCAENVRLVGAREAIAPEPVPLRWMTWGEPAALSTTRIDPVRVPAVIGVKVTDNVQLAAAGTPAPQLSVSAKSPPVVIDEIANDALPILRSRVVCAWLVVPTACAAN